MKQFLLKLLSFIGLFTIVIILLFVIVGLKKKYDLSQIKFSPNIHTLIIGDSHTEMAINDNLIGGIKNISQNSEGYVYSYYKLKALLNNNANIKTVVLGYSYHNLSSYFDYYFYTPAVASRYFFISPMDWKIVILKNNIKNGGSLFNHLVRNINKKEFSFIGQYANYYDLSRKVEDSSINKRLVAQYFTNGVMNDFSNENIMYLGRIVALCKEKNVIIYLLNTPLHANYVNRIPLKFKNEYNRILKYFQVNTIDLSNVNLPDSCFMPDGDHVSVAGANISSERLNDSFKLWKKK